MNRLRELRLSQNLTTVELGKIIHLDPSMITHIEKGKKNFSTESLQRACKHFNVSADYMLGKSAEEMYNNFVEAMHNDFSEVKFDLNGEPYEAISDEVDEPIRSKLDILFRIKDLKDVEHLSFIYAQVAKLSAVEDFSTPLPLDENGEPSASSVPASPEAVKLQNEVIALVRQIKNTSSLGVLLDFTKARLATEGEGDKK